MGRDNQILIGISAVSFSVGAFVLTTTYPKTDGKVGVRLYEGAVALAFMGTVVAMLTVLIGLPHVGREAREHPPEGLRWASVDFSSRDEIVCYHSYSRAQLSPPELYSGSRQVGALNINFSRALHESLLLYA